MTAPLQIKKETSHMGVLKIKPVDKKTAKEMIIANHYSHKWNDGGFGVYNFGIFRDENPDECLGVAVYGYMKNPKAKIFKHPNPDAWITELNRLWISDELGHNSETILIGASLRLLRKIDPNIVAVQSFADGRLGCGTIYKAANFRYYVHHLTYFWRNTRSKKVTHDQILTNTTSPMGYVRSNTAFLLGEMECFAVKTHRYVYPLCKRFSFKLTQKAYPTYDKGEKPVTKDLDRLKIKQTIICLLDKIA